MTPTELKLLDFVRERIAAGLAPTFQEMADHLGVASKSMAARMIGSLVEQGLLRRIPNKERGLMLTAYPDLRGVPDKMLKAELARRGVTLDALDGGERRRFAPARSSEGTGTCAAPGCQLAVQRGHLMCLTHWRALPEQLRHDIIAAHCAARMTRNPDDTRRYGELVGQARDLLDGRCTDAVEVRP